MWAHEGPLKKQDDSHVLIRLHIYKRENHAMESFISFIT
jgi:hypothetical protein